MTLAVFAPGDAEERFHQAGTVRDPQGDRSGDRETDRHDGEYVREETTQTGGVVVREGGVVHLKLLSAGCSGTDCVIGIPLTSENYGLFVIFCQRSEKGNYTLTTSI